MLRQFWVLLMTKIVCIFFYNCFYIQVTPSKYKHSKTHNCGYTDKAHTAIVELQTDHPLILWNYRQSMNRNWRIIDRALNTIVKAQTEHPLQLWKYRQSGLGNC